MSRPRPLTPLRMPLRLTLPRMMPLRMPAASPTRRSGWPRATMIRSIPAWLLLRERCLLPRRSSSRRVATPAPSLLHRSHRLFNFLGNISQQWTEFRPPPPYVQEPPEPNSLTPPFGPPLLDCPWTVIGRSNRRSSPGEVAKTIGVSRETVYDTWPPDRRRSLDGGSSDCLIAENVLQRSHNSAAQSGRNQGYLSYLHFSQRTTWQAKAVRVQWLQQRFACPPEGGDVVVRDSDQSWPRSPLPWSSVLSASQPSPVLRFLTPKVRALLAIRPGRHGVTGRLSDPTRTLTAPLSAMVRSHTFRDKANRTTCRAIGPG